MRRPLSLIALSALALAASACGRRPEQNEAVSPEDNMLIPTDENAADAAPGTDANAAGNAASGAQ